MKSDQNQHNRSFGIKVFGTIKNAFGIAKDEIIRVFTIFFTLWEICGVLSGAENIRRLVFDGLLAALAICLLCFLWGLKKAISGNIRINICGKSVILLRNDYSVNLNFLLHEFSEEEQEKTAFVIGMDRSGKLEVSTHKGILFYVLTLLDSSYICENGMIPSREIQSQIDKVISEKLMGSAPADESAILSSGECILVNLSLIEKAGKQKKTFKCNLLLIANSRKIYPGDAKQIEKVTDENEAYLIIPKALDYLNGSGYAYAMIGVMGSNGLSQPYQVIFSQIINQFARISIKNRDSEDVKRLYVSVWEKDYSRWNVSLSQLESYVQACSRYYRSTGKNFD